MSCSPNFQSSPSRQLVLFGHTGTSYHSLPLFPRTLETVCPKIRSYRSGESGYDILLPRLSLPGSLLLRPRALRDAFDEMTVLEGYI